MSHDIELYQAMRFVTSWYGRYMPRRIDESFVRALFVSGLSKTYASKARVSVVDSESAYTDGKDIFIPLAYLDGRILTSVGIEEDYWIECALLICNGSIVHESLHIRWSPENPQAALETIPEVEKIGLKNPILNACWQITEDIYIESRDLRKFAEMYLKGKNWVFFPSEKLDEFLAEFRSAPSLKTAMPIFVAMKNRMNWKHAAFKERVFQKIQAEFSGLTTFYDSDTSARARTAKRIYDILMELATDEEKQEVQEAMEAADAFEAMEKMFGGEGIDIDGLIGKLIKEFVASLSEEERQELKEAAEEINSDLERMETDIKRREEQGTAFLGIGHHFKNLPDRPSSESLITEVIKEFDSFGGHMFRALETKNFPARPSEDGPHLLKHQLWRIGVDGRVLSHKSVQRKVRGKPEVILLIDASGSTLHYYETHNTSHALIRIETSAAFAAFRSLEAARVPSSVYAHTSESTADGDECVIFLVANSGMPVPAGFKHPGTRDNGFKQLLSADSSENYDGVAIEHVSKLFSAKPGTKLLVSLSDGYPSGSNYWGNEAIVHTKRTVEYVRQQGIDVISLSLVESVVSVNDQIYGKEWNARAFGSLLEKSMKEVIQRALIR